MMVNNTASSNQQSQPPLGTVSVGDFFHQFNWHGLTLTDIEEDVGVETPYETVGQFFTGFPWQGSMDTPLTKNDWNPIIEDDPISIEDDSMTLEDLSALF